MKDEAIVYLTCQFFVLFCFPVQIVDSMVASNTLRLLCLKQAALFLIFDFD